MAIPSQRRLEFLQQRQLFMEMEEEHLRKIAHRLEEYTLPAGEILFAQGDRGSVFYLIFRGKVRVWHKQDGQEVELAVLEEGDLFGEEALLFNKPRSATITALDDTLLFTLDRAGFNWMTRHYPNALANLQALAQAHQLNRSRRFTWLQPTENVFRITRRHWAELAIDLLRPLAIILLSVFFLILSSLIPALSTTSAIIGGILLVVSILWVIWEGIDWTNDYFIITSQRVVWLEEIILQSASRQETPLSAIQSVNVETSQMGRVFGYGNVYVRTFTGTGSLLLTRVDNPNQFRDLIEELLFRLRNKTEKVEADRMRQSIRQSLGLEAQSEEPDEPVIPIPELDRTTRSLLGILKTREVVGDQITYHRHWWVLVVKSLAPLFGMLSVIALTLYLASQNLAVGGEQFPVVTSFLLLTTGFFTFGGLLVYRYLDWKNDIYSITTDMIIDSERKPFGSEITKSAPIENILSLEHNRKGILRLLLNFGSVNIVVADMVFTFIDVHDPAQVQQDIFYRQERLKRDAEETKALQEHERMGEWLRTYHEVWEVEGGQTQAGEDEPGEGTG